MGIFEALILGLIQGFTEFLPVSSSGHLVLCENLLGVNTTGGGTTFEVMVHFATVLATITVFWREILRLLGGALTFKNNAESRYVLKICVSMIPILVVGLFFKDDVEKLFTASVSFIGMMLVVTGCVLTISYLISKYRVPRAASEISYRNAFLVGLAQACAVVPGISRSGSTIATGLALGEKKESLAKFSFLMVLVPIMGEALLQIMDGALSFDSEGLPLLVGFVAAYLSGLLACKVMIAIVSRGKLYYFAVYCFVVGILAMVW